jgi:hypothetical protein
MRMLSFTKICGLNCYDNFCIFYKNNLEIIRTIITMTDIFVPQKFVCNICNYSTSNKKDYNKYLETITFKTYKSPPKYWVIWNFF